MQVFLDASRGINTGEASGDTFDGVLGIQGSIYDDVLVGDAARNYLSGEEGNDTLKGGAEGDDISGGKGDDTLWGETGDDTLAGGEGVNLLIGGDGADTFDGTNGWSVVSYETSTSSVRVDLGVSTNNGGDAVGDSYININAVFGSAHDDTLIANNFGSFLDGKTGNDSLVGGIGIDTLVGGAGDDTYQVGANDGIVEEAGGGTDTVFSAESLTLAANVENSHPHRNRGQRHRQRRREHPHGQWRSQRPDRARRQRPL